MIDSRVPVVAVPDRGRQAPAVLLGPLQTYEEALLAIEYHARGNEIELLTGGLAFVDLDSGDVVKTNWDLGETEEWLGILNHVTANSKAKVTHTFSATDVAVDIWQEDGCAMLQLLDWEAMPDRLDTSRLTEPIHVFRDNEEFMIRCRTVLEWFARVQDQANHDPVVPSTLKQLMSVRAR